ncbi:P-loop containing nucleoside triphosphate hydrolase protein [Cylindrobasidium torrendii FP15055 ss-10]|uniref:p-loop containing nucleoside triphosphate hydrolase protein n=1 Tax=Cylindrobasidium torrendii FP15055 ss-10 TaxID=1314674 RepID=A0A0D7BKP4_9AGAR|nr:P-loop containing nucleoside triphosphate hydrolase protein [Cylindrobasidium torrendii FP15055 ss-10]
MPRPASLKLDTDSVGPNELAYELDNSPPISLYSEYDEETKHDLHNSFDDEKHPSTTSTSTNSRQQPAPSLRLLFSLLSSHHRTWLLLPAILASLISGGIAPFMTVAIGQVFNAFALFHNSNGTEADKQKILHDTGIGSIELIGLAIGSIALGSITSGLWISTGEHNVMNLRKYVYAAVTSKDLTWFDTKMGTEGEMTETENNDGPVGAGGLMANFSRETDEVRMASSLASGRLIQYLATCITCLGLAFSKSWALTLVILASVPVLLIVQSVSQTLANPQLAAERSQTSIAGTIIDRAVSAIATVKAFNATTHESSTLDDVLGRLRVIDHKIVSIWGFTSGVSQFVMMSMFVQAFWFGSKLVRQGTLEPGDVMAVFWACLIATSNLQLCVPQFITLTRGKFAMVDLLALAESTSDKTPRTPTSPTSMSRMLAFRHRVLRSQDLRGIVPSGKPEGSIEMSNVTFSYPSRPTIPVLQDVTMWFASNEITFIVGGSGSGKSTISNLLLRLYKPTLGSIEFDRNDMVYLDGNWTKEHIFAVSQHCILFDMSVHDNVAMGLSGCMGRRPDDVTREEVEDACRTAFIHDFIRDLPNGYDTLLGSGGANLSGGQKQRLAIARAVLRDPTVLILDEATSSLDPTSRVVVFNELRRWRKGKTTIVITHDLSQICPQDFVYVLRGGSVGEQGYRDELEKSAGPFRELLDAQGPAGLPIKTSEASTLVVDSTEGSEETVTSVRHTFMPTLHGSAILGSWMFDVVADLTAKAAPTQYEAVPTLNRESQRVSRFVPLDEFTGPIYGQEPRLRRPSSGFVGPNPPESTVTTHTRRYSLQFSPTTPVFKDPFATEKRTSMVRRPRATLDDVKAPTAPTLEIKSTKSELSVYNSGEEPATPASSNKSLLGIMRDVYPHLPYKPLIAFGLVLCVCSGAITPIFSFVLSRLFFEVSSGAENTSVINRFGGIILAIAAADGLLIGSKYCVMETSAMIWITRMRRLAFKNVLAQDKKWFDKSGNDGARVIQVIMKDGDDARNLIAVVAAQLVVVTVMFSLGLIWALVRGWQLTLAGFAIGPVFAGAMALQARYVANCELRNKRAREDVGRGYYEAISNIRGIRAMAFERIFTSQFDAFAEKALKTGIRGAFVEGLTLGLSSGLIYLAEALIFYVGAVLLANGTYDYLQLLEVLNMVVFTVSIGSQLMAFTEKIAKSTNATRDLHELINLTTTTDESRGVMKPEINGNITFHSVDFAYPERPDVPVLKGLDLDLRDGECVAIVGSSGCGKSTIASLLQRIYEPSAGTIWMGLTELRSTNTTHLRDHVSVVSQNPHLFDATIAENIRYGNAALTQADIIQAAREANVHDFIESLPDKYETMVGDNASLISGGQAQRLQIARALARPSRVLILDECTSALDPANQAAVLDTIRRAKVGRTTVMITHKLPAMKTCDRIVVIADGRVAEEGTFDQLIARGGAFADLISGGGIVTE